MDSVLDDLAIQVRRCRSAASRILEGEIAEVLQRMQDTATEFAKAWCGSFLGYHANIYYRGFRPISAGDHFDVEWGRGSQNWIEYDYDTVWAGLLKRAILDNLKILEDTNRQTKEVFDDAKSDVLATLDAFLAEQKDTRILELRQQIVNIESHVDIRKISHAFLPKQAGSRDSGAVYQGIRVPAHLNFLAAALETRSYGTHLSELADATNQAQKYVEKRFKMRGTTVTKKDGKIFIGHGRSPVWRDLKDFLTERMGLVVTEFNLEPAAGLTTVERLQEMLDEACFAFLVMTAEDEHADSTHHARENVVHEAGLFQGRLGFRRAIILLEDSCAEFSNIIGLGQIRFPKGDIKARSEEIRRVLEREQITGVPRV